MQSSFWIVSCKDFHYNYVAPHLLSEPRNLKSAITWPKITQQKIDKKVTEGRVGGPFAYPPLPNLRVSPLGLVDKKNSGD